jgi:hypothetical protein
MNIIELKFAIELTKKIESNEVTCLQDAFDFGKGKSLINRKFVNQVYTLNQK